MAPQSPSVVLLLILYWKIYFISLKSTFELKYYKTMTSIGCLLMEIGLFISHYFSKIKIKQHLLMKVNLKKNSLNTNTGNSNIINIV